MIVVYIIEEFRIRNTCQFSYKEYAGMCIGDNDAETFTNVQDTRNVTRNVGMMEI